ncbi:2Fe-2S iron-sulfur cluster-binding protein [Microbacterium sp. MYb64]|uniref:2Fe-2S iron-sulfur cluster-binding protein n=1 Tax=Microbacterium sp. MYb64 TaxID=1848691 RepID=UPI000CFC6295|nr:2Fe-2S iron-sulfur cluster-binding protein [Microbacterium sp. MYb64]PRB06988.1 ferredoxin [Microbacterium sp. MYb64]
MPRVTYRRGAEETVVDVPIGISLMETAIEEDIDGIIGECGGNAMCATCHVYVASDQVDRLRPMADDEDEMLQCTASERRANSRLSCQIFMTDELVELVVELPEEQ